MHHRQRAQGEPQERHGSRLRRQRVRLPGRVPRGGDGQEQGGKQIIGRRRPAHPAGRHLDRRLPVLRQALDPKIKVLVGYSGDFVKSGPLQDRRREPDRAGRTGPVPGRGGCGLGTLKAADEHEIWGIGVDKDQYNDAKRVLTSGVKRVDDGVFSVIKRSTKGSSREHRPALQPEERRHGRGQINPAVPQEFIDKMNELKQKIISGQVKVPATLQ